MTVLAMRPVTPGMECPDAEIVRRVRGGDVDAYRSLVERYHGRCLRYAVRMLDNRADAEEVVQDAFTKAYRYLGSYRERDAFAAWLMQILVNEVRTAAVRRRRDDRALVSLDDASELTAPRGADAESVTDVQQALGRLDPSHREAIVLKYVDGRTYEDMAVITGLRVSALKMRVKRARAHLEALLEEWTDD